MHSMNSYFFFFNQKTAYEMRISDWSSDVCSSDLLARGDPALDLFADDVVAQLDAFVADEHGRPGNQLADFVLRLAAEGAIEGALAVRATQFRHKSSYGEPKRGVAVLILAPGHPITIWQLGDMG